MKEIIIFFVLVISVVSGVLYWDDSKYSLVCETHKVIEASCCNREGYGRALLENNKTVERHMPVKGETVRICDWVNK